MPKLTIEEKYNNLKNELEKYECKLVTTIDEIKNSDKIFSHYRINIISKCGHETNVQISNFMRKHTGINCKKCNLKKSKNTKFNDNFHKYESICLNKVINLLKDKYECKKTNEGCKADMMIRNKKSNLNEWIGIQLKTTKSLCHNMYSFHIKNSYNNMLVICYCINENKMWLFKYENISHTKNINICKNSKYNKYLTTNLLDDINKLYNEQYKFNKELLLLPQSKEQQKEYKYACIRKEKLPFLKFIEPEYENMCYDFIINNYKIQEKVSFIRKDRGYLCIDIHKRNGKKKNGKKHQILYQKGDNDFYWFNIEDSNIFYIIPENIMIQHNLVSKETEIINSKIINFNKPQYKWLSDYKYDYSNINKEQIQKIFNIT
jgi:hypothetical protein